MVGRIIKTQACIDEGTAFLAASEPRFAHAVSLTGPLPLRRREDGFKSLLDAIVSQQISVAAADSIWARLEGVGAVEVDGLALRSDEDLRACGLSRQKIGYARALAGSGIDFVGLRETPTPEVIATLVAVKGIGAWTAEIYAMFSLGRADVFAPGDLALQEAYRLLFEIDERPKEKAFREIANAWSPWRGVAARLLWAYYHVAKEKQGIR